MPDTLQDSVALIREALRHMDARSTTGAGLPTRAEALAALAVLVERAERADGAETAALVRERLRMHEERQRAAAAEARVVELEEALRKIKRRRSALFLDGYCEDIIDRALAAGSTERPQEWRDLNASGDGAMNQTSPFGAAVERTQE